MTDRPSEPVQTLADDGVLPTRSTGDRGADARAPAGHSVAVFALTAGGSATARRIAAALEGGLRLPTRLVGVHGFERVGDALREDFAEGRALVCVMAAGVVVRSLAPVLRGKLKDPPVLVVDEAGRYVVPILSGHAGGGNELARRVACVLEGTAVLTTSTDVQGLLGPDLLALALDAHVRPRAALLPVASALADGHAVDLWYDADELGPVADFLAGLPGYRARKLSGEEAPPLAEPSLSAEPAVAAVVVTMRLGVEILEEVISEGVCPECVVHMTPRWIVAGVGCTRGTGKDALAAAIQREFSRAGLRVDALRAVASSAAKEQEPGLLEAADALGVPAVFADNGSLERVIADRGLAVSDWVRESIGVGAVCEPAALWAAGTGAVLVGAKAAEGGVTVALARVDGASLLAARQEERTT